MNGKLCGRWSVWSHLSIVVQSVRRLRAYREQSASWLIADLRGHPSTVRIQEQQVGQAVAFAISIESRRNFHRVDLGKAYAARYSGLQWIGKQRKVLCRNNR